jgi:putative mRNA 3-end processing factor
MTNNSKSDPTDWLTVTDEGLYVVPGDFYVDPQRGVDRAVITHGHADHARPKNKDVWATPATIEIMKTRYGKAAGEKFHPTDFHETVEIGQVTVGFYPAGHVLGSAQISLDYGGTRVVVSGDFKRSHDPTCTPYEQVPDVDVFITEATFGLPVFNHPDPRGEMDKLLASIKRYPTRCHLIGAYGLGKGQRVIKMMRDAGYDDPIYLHGALWKLCQLYEELGVKLGKLEKATIRGRNKSFYEGTVVMGPPSATRAKWARRFPDPVLTFASGWMTVRQRARQKNVELPLIISDHADWPALIQTLNELEPDQVWVTHGREDALVHWANQRGFKASALRLVGYGEEGEDINDVPPGEESESEAA